jgi:glucokinase
MPDPSPAADSPGARLLADVGGTNARFAWQADRQAAIEHVYTLPAADHPTLSAALARYLEIVGRAAPPECSIAIANPVIGDQVTMTNHHWTFSISALKAEFGFRRLLVLNDFTALALALPALTRDELRQVGGNKALPGTAIALIGPGTGLGVSGLVPTGRHQGHQDAAGAWVPLQGEGGHITLAGRTPREQLVLDHIADRYGHASAERAVSGQGLVDIHRALRAIDHPWEPNLPLAAAEITELALKNSDALCLESLNLFCAFLGTAAGNLALTLGAQGGVYIGGGIVPRLGLWFDQSPFRTRFEAKGRFVSYLASIPAFVIDAKRSPAFLGASRALDSSSCFAGEA